MMKRFLNSLFFFKENIDTFSNQYGSVVGDSREWEKAYRQRWQYDKIVRSTHGVNCTGSCSWNVYVKNGLITWEIQATDYPRTRPDLPNHEPRGCQRGASYSWYLYSSARLKYPLIRSTLLGLWRKCSKKSDDPVIIWELIVSSQTHCDMYKKIRGLGGFVRVDWDDVTDIIASANIYTIKVYGPDRVVGFSPIPAMSMISYAAGSRYLSLIGGACCSFYDWYCDLPPSSPQTWGEQTDVPESADWYNSSFLIAWGSNVPQTRTPDAHFFVESRYKGTKTVAITPDYSEVSKLCDLWLAPKQGTDSALAMAMGFVVLKEFYIENKSIYFEEYIKNYTDFPFLVFLNKLEDGSSSYVPGRMVRASDFLNNLNVKNNPEWKTVLFDKNFNICVPNGCIGSRWGDVGLWNLEMKDIRNGNSIEPIFTVFGNNDSVVSVSFPYYAGFSYKHFAFTNTNHNDVLKRNVPVKEISLFDGMSFFVATVFDLFVANYGVDRGLGGFDVTLNYDDDVPYTPCWQESITGVKRDDVIKVARQFAQNADLTCGRSMIIIGAGMNHWYHMDMNYRGIINLLVMCGCVGKSGGGWAHYVGQEKLRPQAGWLPLAFALDWARPPRQMNSTSFFYNHTSQWRYEKLQLKEILSPLASYDRWKDLSLIDCNVMAEKMGWLPSCPQLEENPLVLTRCASEQGVDVVEYIIRRLKDKSLKMSCEDPDNFKNFPRNLFVWRSNLLGSSGKGHEYFLKYLLGTQHGVLGKDSVELGGKKPREVVWHNVAPRGKLDLLVTLDFRMSTTCLYSDIVLPTASFYEKDDLNTSDMHPFIHPLQAAVDPVWESKTDWEIYKLIAKKFSKLVVSHLGVEKDIVLLPLLHDSPMELGQPLDVKQWFNNECELVPGKTMPKIFVVERNYLDIYKKFVSLGPLMSKLGNNIKGVSWSTEEEVEYLKQLNKVVLDTGVSYGLPKIETAIDAAEVILTLAPETNGYVAVRSWSNLSKITGIDHTHLAINRMCDRITFRDVAAQPRKIITAPTWSGIESEEVSYNANYINVHELIPWRTLTGRQQLYQDHMWMRDFGESLCVYKPPINTKTVECIVRERNFDKFVLLNFITPHQKWGIHSTYTDNLLMLTLSRGGVIVWISEVDAKKINVVDNDWVEAFNLNGAIAARVVVSQRVPEGMILQYHAQEKLMHVPVASETMCRGGIHNSVTRVSTKPTHMIGGYAQLSYGFNYYGTVGSNRDEFIILRKLENIEWKMKKEHIVYNGEVV